MLCCNYLKVVAYVDGSICVRHVPREEFQMARKGVAILREIAMVKASDVADAVKVQMLRELNDELAKLYAPGPASTQVEIPFTNPELVKKK